MKCLSLVDDHSRVILSYIENVPGSDYINANYIDVSMRFVSFWNTFFCLFKESVSSSIPCTWGLFVCLSWPMKVTTTKANQETARARHAG